MAAPIIPATLAINFGVDTQVGGGGYELSRDNTGGVITGGFGTNAFTGTNATHFQINADGVISVSQAGRDALLNGGPYTITATVYSVDASDSVSITVTILPNTQHVGVGIEAVPTTASPTTYTQIFRAMQATDTAGLATAYGGTTIAKNVIYRPDTTATFNTAMFEKCVNTGVITHTSEDPLNPFVLVVVAPGTRAGDRRWSPRNVRFENWTMQVTLDRYAEKTGSFFGAVNGQYQGVVQFYRCTFACTPVADVGHGYSFKGMWIANTAPSLDTYVLYDQCTISGYWNRALSPIFKSPTSKGFVVQDCLLTGIRSDGIQLNGPGEGVVLRNNNLENFTTDTYMAGYASSAQIARTNAALNVVDGTTATLVWQNSDFRNGGRVIDFGGIEVRYNNDPTVAGSGAYDATMLINIKAPGGALIYSGSTTTKFIKGCRQSAILSINTAGTSRLWIREERGVGVGTWIEELAFTAAGQTVDLTSTILVGGVLNTLTSSLLMVATVVWPGQALNAASAAVQSSLFDSTGNMTEELFTAAKVTYGDPNLAIFNHFTLLNVAAPPNRGNGGPLTKSGGAVEAAHGDMIQGAPGGDVSGWIIDGNVLVGYNTLNAIEGGRYNFTGYQPFFFEDVNPDTDPTAAVLYLNQHYTSCQFTNNISLGSSNYGLAVYNPVNCTIEKNTILYSPSFPRTKLNSHGGVRVGTHNGGTGSGNIVRRNIHPGPSAISIDTGITIDTALSIDNLYYATSAKARTQAAGVDDTAFAWTNLFVGDGGVHDYTSAAKVRAAFGRKPAGYLAVNDIGANPTVATPGAPPVNTVLPSINPGADSYVGSVLVVANTGTWTNTPTSYTYQWYKDAVALTGATSTTFTTTATGSHTVRIIAINAAGSSTAAESNAIAITTAPVYAGANDQIELNYASTGNVNVLANDLLMTDVTTVTGGTAFVTATVEADNTITVAAQPGFHGVLNLTVNLTGNAGAVSRTSVLQVTVLPTKTFTLTTT